MEKRSIPNKTAKYVLVFILIAAAAAVLIFSLVNNNKPAQSKAYGESYAAALISDIQGSSAVEYTVKRDSFDHSSVWVPRRKRSGRGRSKHNSFHGTEGSAASRHGRISFCPGRPILGHAHALYRQRKRYRNRVRHCLRPASPENTRRAGRRLSPSPLRCRCGGNGCAAWDGWGMML